MTSYLKHNNIQTDLVFVGGLHLKFVLSNFSLTLLPEVLDGCLQTGVQQVTNVNTLR